MLSRPGPVSSATRLRSQVVVIATGGESLHLRVGDEGSREIAGHEPWHLPGAFQTAPHFAPFPIGTSEEIEQVAAKHREIADDGGSAAASRTPSRRRHLLGMCWPTLEPHRSTMRPTTPGWASAHDRAGLQPSSTQVDTSHLFHYAHRLHRSSSGSH